MEIIYLFIGVYLLAGFIYSIYVVLNQGGNIFSIPLNTIFGLIFVPINAWFASKKLIKSPKKS